MTAAWYTPHATSDTKWSASASTNFGAVCSVCVSLATQAQAQAQAEHAVYLVSAGEVAKPAIVVLAPCVQLARAWRTRCVRHMQAGTRWRHEYP